jgi:Tol biopolymer transport system component
LFFREVNLPFSEAVKDPSKIRWRFGAITKGTTPPVVLENLPVCGNCHSFTRKGEVLAMDVDYASSKGSYIITRTAQNMTLATSDIITWDDYRREEGTQTFGLLSQISPDGRYVLSTVKDRSVFVPRPELAFSQLFFPLKGILGLYDRETKQFSALPGANDPALVQSNPTWSPDGRWVVFARARAGELEKRQNSDSILLTPEECEEFLSRGKEFKYDLYRVPFNEGKGGKPEPLIGASANGRSNFFPKYSPDSRWIVFCQAANYMLLQPDSALCIIPAEGGEARRLGCNLTE